MKTHKEKIMKNWLISLVITLILFYHVSCMADSYPKTIPIFTGDINDPEVYIVDYEEEYYIVEYDGIIYCYPLE
jgi:hypothetical protein